MLDEFRQRFCFDRNIFVEDFDFTLVYINVDFIAGFNLFYVGTDYQRGVTVSVGKIEGGSATNTVPAFCKCVVDFRLPDLRRCL